MSVGRESKSKSPSIEVVSLKMSDVLGIEPLPVSVSAKSKNTLVKITPLKSLDKKYADQKQLHEREARDDEIFYPSEKKLEDVIIPANVLGHTSEELAKNILAKFNEGLDKAHTELATTGYFGGIFRTYYRVNPGHFLLTAHNEVPALIRPKNNTDRLVMPIYTSAEEKNEVFGQYKQSDVFYGQYGKYVLNVPPGKYALTWSGQKPQIRGPGFHMISDPQFHIDYDAKKSIDGQDCFVNQNSRFIQHGNEGANIKVIRVIGGELAMVWVGADAWLLKSSDQPYVFTDPMVKVRMADEKRKQPFFDFNALHISHPPIQLIRVQGGEVVKMWHGSKPELLEARDTPYQFKNGQIQVATKTVYYKDGTSEAREERVPSDAPLTVHGSIKRLFVKEGDVAVTYEDGRLKIIDPKIHPQPYIIDSVKHVVEKDLLSTRLQTLVFPSAETIAERKNLPLEAQEIDVFTSLDSVPVGVKLMVSYQVMDAEKAIKELGSTREIVRHLENVTRSEMNKAVRSCTYQQCLASRVSVPRDEKKHSDDILLTHREQERRSLSQDDIKITLNDKLKSCGIELVRLSIEELKNLNPTIAAQMANLAVETAKIETQEAIISKQTQLAIDQQNQNSRVATMKQENTNAILIKTAEAERQAAEIRAKAVEIEAKGQAQALLAKADAEAGAIVMKAKAEKQAMEMQGQALQSSQVLSQLKLAETISSALSKANIYAGITPDQLAAFKGLGIFAQSDMFKALNPAEHPKDDSQKALTMKKHN